MSRRVDHRSLPLDARSAGRVEDAGLRMTLVDTADVAAFDEWIQADALGFHDGVQSPESLERMRESLAYRRTTGVYDSDEARPVATVSSWAAELTVAGPHIVPAWAISAVTVRPTHAGRGVARAMLEGELRTAAAAGLPLAVLTVSESTLYGRYGFAPTALVADLRIDAKRAGWAGPVPAGRIDLIDREVFRARLDDVYNRVRERTAGHIDSWAGRFDHLAGTAPGLPEAETRVLRAASYSDGEGVVTGLLLYSLHNEERDFTAHRLDVRMLVAETPDAAAALWRLALGMPLVREVHADLRSEDDPVRWQVADWRAVRMSTRDHLWSRVLDLPALVAARGWRTAGRVALTVHDGLGFVDGSWLITASSDGTAVAEAIDAVPADVPALEVDAPALATLLVGGARAATLVAAGRIAEARPGDAAAADTVLDGGPAPWTPIWF